MCPVLEEKWVPGWAPMKVITESGFAEKDCVFITPGTPRPSIWVVTKHDPVDFALEMYKITPEHTVGKLEINLKPNGTGTEARVSYDYTAIGKEGEGFLAGFTTEWYLEFMKRWEKAMNHFLLTGSKISG